MTQTLLPFAFVLVAVFPFVYSVAFALSVFPLPDVGVVLDAHPDTVSVLYTLDKFTIIDLPILPSINALTMRLIVSEIALVVIAGRIVFIPVATAFIAFPVAFVDSSVIVHADTFSLSFAPIQLPFVNAVFVTFDPEIISFPQFVVVENV